MIFEIDRLRFWRVKGDPFGQEVAPALPAPLLIYIKHRLFISNTGYLYQKQVICIKRRSFLAPTPSSIFPNDIPSTPHITHLSFAASLITHHTSFSPHSPYVPRPSSPIFLSPLHPSFLPIFLSPTFLRQIPPTIAPPSTISRHRQPYHATSSRIAPFINRIMPPFLL